jgi:hypothetical protein
MSNSSPQQAAIALSQISSMARREGGLVSLIFEVELSPALLPENTPADIVSAWIRLQQAAKDIRLIEKRLNLDEDN